MDSIEKQLKKIGDNIKKQVDGFVSFQELFNDSFIQAHSKFKSFDELFDNGGFKHETEEEFSAIDDAQLDQYLKNNTDFDSWEDMQHIAAVEHVKKKLGN